MSEQPQPHPDRSGVEIPAGLPRMNRHKREDFWPKRQPGERQTVPAQWESKPETAAALSTPEPDPIDQSREILLDRARKLAAREQDLEAREKACAALEERLKEAILADVAEGRVIEPDAPSWADRRMLEEWARSLEGREQRLEMFQSVAFTEAKRARGIWRRVRRMYAVIVPYSLLTAGVLFLCLIVALWLVRPSG